MLKRLALVALVVVAAAAMTTPIFAAISVQGNVGSVADGTGLTAGCRYYSVSGANAEVNMNQCFTSVTACCPNPGGDPLNPTNQARCIRAYTSNTLLGGGFVCNQENTAGYNNDANNQTFYNLVDAEYHEGLPDHVGFFAVQGQIAGSSAGNNPGSASALNCAGTTNTNCFTRADSTNSRATPITSTAVSYGGTANQISSAGGLSPIPVVQLCSAAQCSPSCGSGSVCLKWEDPHTYAGTMKNGVPSPVLGVNLYSNPAQNPTGNNGWSLIGTFPLGTGGGTCLTPGGGVCVSGASPATFGLNVRVKGPGTGPTELEPLRVPGTVQPSVGGNSAFYSAGTAVRIVSLTTRYAGRNTVYVNFTSGVEGGVQGYYVTRASTPAGPYTRVSDQLSVTGDNSRYSYADHVNRNLDRMVYYQIEIVKADGTVEHSGTAVATLPSPKGKKLGN